jgi:hypothetical protein
MQDPASTVRPGDHVRVQVSTPMAYVTPFLPSLRGGPLQVRAAIDVTVEG